MAKALSQLSSFLRFGPVPSHNLLVQMLKLEEKYTLHFVHCHWDCQKMLLSQTNPVLEMEKIAMKSYFYSKMKICFTVYNYLHCMCTILYTVYSMNPSQYMAGRKVEKTIAATEPWSSTFYCISISVIHWYI